MKNDNTQVTSRRTGSARSRTRLKYLWQRQSINLVFNINRKQLAIHVKFIELSRRTRFFVRASLIIVAAVLVLYVIVPAISTKLAERSYALTNNEKVLLPDAEQALEKDIFYSAKTSSYLFQNMQSTSSAPAGSNSVSSGSTMLSASLPSNASNGISITDPINQITLKVTPTFPLSKAQQDSSHIYYPFANGDGQLVYSPEASNVLEDLVLRNSPGNTANFDYNLDLGNDLAARTQSNGSVDIYGSSLSNLGNISTSDASDAARVAKAEQNAPKTKLLFTIPAPTIKETDRGTTVVKAHYSLLKDGSVLRLTATNLNKASYPLDIDPTVSVQSVSELNRDTNGESDVNFNTSTDEITRGAVTGGIFSDTTGWTTNSNSLNTKRFLDSAVISNGYAYAAGGATNSNSDLSSVEYAQISTSNNTIGTWTTTTALPTALSQFRLLTYNGYLYVLGGSTSTTGCASPTLNTYYNPTQPNGALASSWTSTTSLPSGIGTGLCSFGAAIYNNTIYVVGGQIGSGTTNGTTGVYYASILPSGAIGSWTTSAVSLPTSLYAEDVQIYNGYIYVIGGDHAGTLASTIYEAPLNSAGGIYGTSSAEWTSLSNTFASADGSVGISNLGGGSFTTVNDGYMYVSGGCTGLTATYSCTNADISGSTYIAQINADGTLGPWSKIASSNNDTEVGGSLTVFGGYLYVIAGCTSMIATTIECTNAGDTLATQFYAQILSYGQIGPVVNNYTLPASLYQASTVVYNGIIYVIGGCLYANATTSCEGGTGDNDTSDAIYCAPISAAGGIGSWTTSTHTINGSVGANKDGIAAAGAAAYDGYIYLIGGYNYTNGASSSVWYVQTSSTSCVSGNFATYGTALTHGEYSNAVFADRGYIFSIGGCYATTNTAGCSTYVGNVTTDPTYNYQLAVGSGGPTALNKGTSYVTAEPTAELGTACTNIYTTYPADCYPGNAAQGVAVYNNYVYLAGGASTGNGQSVVVEYAPISTAGVVGAWTAATNYLPNALRRTSAYAFNGYLYVIGGHDGDTNVTYNTVDIGQINLSTDNLNAAAGIFSSSSTLPDGEWDGSVVAADGTVYVVGGCYTGNPPAACSAIGNGVQTFQIYNADNDGTASWTNQTYSPSTNTVGAATVAYNGYIYSAGGCTSFTLTTTCAAVNTDSTYSPLEPDGNVGNSTQNWSTPATLSGGTAFGCLLEANNYLYFIGGENASGTPEATVSYSLIGANGVPGAWSTTTALTIPLTRMGCDSFDGTLYIVGGISTGTTYENQVYYAQPSSSTGLISSWSNFSSTTFTNARAGLTAVAAGGYLYMIGGYNGTTYYNDVQYIAINPSTGAFSGSWSSTSSIPYPTAFMASTVANGYLFLFGGNTGTATTSCTNTTYIAPLVDTGTLGAWTAGVNNFTTARMGATGAYYNGYYYVLGGYGCSGSAIVNADQVVSGGEQSQSMAAYFTRYANLGGNAAPELFLAFVTNAQNDSVDIEDWQMSYITSTSVTNAWGASTTIPNITSGTVSNVYAYNSSDTNVYLNQYIQIAFTISQTKSFSFPDSTQPSVNSYYVYYSPAPQNRLRNGKDFQDEQQQGFDLNY